MKRTYKSTSRDNNPQRNLALSDRNSVRPDSGDGIASDQAVKAGKNWVDSNEK